MGQFVERIGRSLPQTHVVGVVYVAGMFMSIMDSTVVNTALPAIAGQFHTTPAAADWVVIGYLLSLAVWIPASGWVGDRIGTKATYLLALGVFVGASAFCGLSGSLGQLVITRVLQGVGGGMLAPVGQAMLFREFPPERRAQASAVLVIPTVLAPAIGPVIGGFLVVHLSWHWVFFINVPIGLAVMLFGLLFLREHRETGVGRFDVPGFFLTAVGLGLLLYAISEGPLVGWGSPRIDFTGIAGVAMVAALVWVELRRRHPMLTFRLFHNRLFRYTNLVSFFGGSAFLGVLFLLPQFLQEARGANAFASGLTTFPEAIGVVVSTQIVVRLYGRIGPRRLMFCGLFAVGIGMTLLSQVGLTTSAWLIRLLVFALGVGMAYMFLPLQAASFAQISSRDMGRASAIFNTQRQVASAAGVAVVGTVLASFLSTRLHVGGMVPPAQQVWPFHAAFMTAAALAWIGALLALGIRDHDARETMVNPRRRRQPQEKSEMLIAD